MLKGKKDLSNKISVVIITHNRVSTLLETLQNLRSLPEKFPIFVVDNNSTDNTVGSVKTLFPEVNIIALPKNMVALGRNIGVQHAVTPYIAFCDDDSWWDPGSLTKAVEYFEQYPNVGVLAGKILVGKQGRLDHISALQSISPLPARVDMPGPAILGFLGCQLIIRKEAYLQAGGYSEVFYFSGEEELLGWDIVANGWGMTYCHDIVGRHYPSVERSLAMRYRLGSRNTIMRAWMRRPIRQAIKKIFEVQAHSSSGIYDVIGALQGVLSIPKALKHRRVLPSWVEEQIVMLERQQRLLVAESKQKQQRFSRSKVQPLTTEIGDAGV